MCGIAGYKASCPVDAPVLKKMVRSLYHRGPDAEGFYSSGDYHAGMRRLRINDLKTGDQPLFNSDKSVVLFYNGEIYNSPELRIELEHKGYRFRTRSDGEVICHLYDECQEELFEKLDGMFAAALWIKKERKLILARDIPGEKPLYYTCLNDKDLVFASELKSLVLFPGLDLTLNYQALWDFPTFSWIPEPDTVYRKIQSLPRAHLLICDDNGIRLVPYLNKFNKQPLIMTDENIIDETRRVVSNAVKSRLLSDVPVGCFLSGGLDSSIVATLAKKSLPSLDTFTIGFDDIRDPFHGKADESVYSASYAKALGTKHHTIRFKAKDFREELLAFCSSLDQPFSVSSALGIRKVAQAANAAGIKVLLSGDCADESFGGYSWYFYLMKHESKRKRTHKTAQAQVVTFNNVGLDIPTRLSILNKYTSWERAWAWHYYASESEKAKLYNPDLFNGITSSLRFFKEFKSGNDWAAIDFIRNDREFYLLNEMLQKIDRMTMAYSVEGRVPFAAPIVLSHAEKLEYKHMVRENYLKWALRKAFRDILPKEIYERPKHGFNLPVEHWFRDELSDLFEEAFSPSSNLMRIGFIHKKSRNLAYSMLQDKLRLNGSTIFSFVVLNKWLENNKWDY